MAFRPLFEVGDVVYLVESAKLGSLESYIVAAVVQNTSKQAVYTIGIPAKPPTAISTVGDRITLKKSFDFSLGESELTDLCTAVSLAKAAAQRQLDKIESIESQFCAEEGTGGSA